MTQIEQSQSRLSGPQILIFDLFGTFVVAIEGAMKAADNNLDIVGLVVLAIVTSTAGGIIRDLLIGAIPPAAIQDWRYTATAFTGAMAVFFFHEAVGSLPQGIFVVADAAGLSLFAVSGAGKALGRGIAPFLAVILGTISGVGGGTVRDVLLAQIPTVLRADVYATAAAAGAAVLVIGLRLRAPPVTMAFVGGTFCFALRLVAYALHWNLPKLITP